MMRGFSLLNFKGKFPAEISEPKVKFRSFLTVKENPVTARIDV